MSLYTEEERLDLQKKELGIFLETFVPLAIWELQRNGGPDTRDRELARCFGAVLASHGDAPLFPTKAKEATAGRERVPGTQDMAGQLARYLAVMAFSPGGVTFHADEPLHYKASLDPDEAIETTGENQDE